MMEKAWQKFLENSLQHIVNSGDIHSFSKLSNLEDLIEWFISDDSFTLRLSDIKKFKETFLSLYSRTKKDSLKSEELRKKGNDFFKLKKYEEALNYYNQSVALAPVDEGNSLALAIANRSAVLYHLEKYQDCIEDIKHAIAAGYPPQFQYKLLQRKAQCLFYQGFKEFAIIEFDDAKAAIQDSIELTPARKVCLLKDIEDFLNNSKASDFNIGSSSTNAGSDTPVVTGTVGTVLLNASDRVQLCYSEEEGRHLVAGQLINPSDTLLVEKPYAAVLLPDNYRSHCHHCFTKLPLNPLFCEQCTIARYCGQECKKDSWTTYHCLECQYMELMHTIGVAHLSLRIILKTGFKQLLDFRKKYQIHGERNFRDKGLSSSGKYEQGYLAIHELIHHANKMTTNDLYHYSLTAVLLLEVLKSMNFFNLSVKPEAEPEQKENRSNADHGILLYIGGLLLRHILQIVCNAHAITELKSTKDETNDIVSTQNQVRIATGLYPTASLMNHSCDPSVISSFQKDVMILRAVKFLDPGEEIYNCYGPHCRRMCRSDRQEILQNQYMFICRCVACQEEPDQLEFSQAIRCSKCSGPVLQQHQEYYTCVACKAKVEAALIVKQFRDAEELFFKGVMLLEKEQYQDALVKLFKCLKQREKLLYKHNQHLGHTYDCIARCLAALGQFGDSAEFLKKSVAVTKVIYGNDSIEMANELQKLAEVQVNNGDFVEAKRTCLPAINIFETYYGTSHYSTMEMKKLFVQLTMSDT